jgi:polyhydroxyalkanoate synthesis regulator phasin
MAIDRITGTSNPRLFPDLWNSTATEIEAAQSDITDLQSDVTTAQSDITTSQSDITTLQSDVTTLQSDVTSAESDITTLQSDMTTAQSDITTLQGQVGTTELFKCGIVDHISVNGAFDDIAVFDTSDELLNVGTFTYTSSAITIPTTGVYMVSWSIYVDGSVIRGNPFFGLRVNGADNDTIVTAHSYLRDEAGHNEVTSNGNGLISLTASDTVGLRTLALAATGTLRTNGNYGSFSLYRVGSAS